MRSAAERAVTAVVNRIDVGHLRIETPDGRIVECRGSVPGPEAAVRVRDPRAFRRLVTAGSVGLAEGNIEGEWDTPDLCAVLDLATANLLTRAGGRSGIPEPLAPLQRLVHRSRPNTLRGARSNIRRHYDLGNDFYRLWLDESLTYSSACFEPGCEDLGSAQVRKWDRILEMLDPRPGDRLLEVGCGWGGFAMHAARNAGVHVTGISLSREQTALARERVSLEGLDELVDLRIQDYRHVREHFDGVVSIEMFEAVGERYWPAFYRAVRKALSPGRRAVVQTITIADDRFERYRRRADFIQKYIFPGGMLPSPAAFGHAARGGGLSVGEPRFFGESYARTLSAWLERFDDAKQAVTALGFDERFVRMWRYYLAYCRAGFKAGTIDVMQVPLETR